MTILVVGGGAAGMAAAIEAAADGRHEVVVIERQSRVGRKLLATGNGRCNLSNLHADPARYHGEAPDFCRPALARFGVDETLRFFRSLGLVTAAEPSGRVYPYSDQAGSVVDVLRFALARPNVRLLTGCEVTRVWQRGGGFLLKTTADDLEGDRLIVAAGGAAGEALGGSRRGYALLRSLGHHCTALFPALVQIMTAEPAVRALKGVRAQAALRLLDGDAVIAETAGEVQFTETGVSGPAVFELSRAVSTGRPGLRLLLDLTPRLAPDELLSLLEARRAALPALTASDLLTGVVHNRLGRVLVKAAGLAAETPLSRLDGPALGAVVSQVKSFSLTCTGTRGFDSAQVTAGGVRTSEFDPETMESRLVPGLYACGEVLDIDGDCGGFNLQWAWSSGRLAGQSAAGKGARP